MKKFLFFFSVLFTFNIYAATTKSDMYGNRGLELIREANFNQISELSKASGSLQTFETYFEKNKKVDSKGILLGTVSNFVDAKNIHAGLTVAYQKYKFENNYFNTRDYALNTYLSYRKESYLFTLGLAYSQSKKLVKRAYSGTFEIGKFFKGKNYDFFDKTQVYIYTGLDSNKWKQKKIENTRFINYRLGLSTYHFIKNLRFTGNLELNTDNKRYTVNRDKLNLSFSYAVAYQIYDDLLIELKYKGTKNKKFYNNLVSLGFTHNF
ncbi:MAG: hypothetical protein Q4A58_02750 [Fusobacterium sp.]|uniref:hypothetical protein n=1 Tax=Fusobacterium sp. TaxID=68766 RepID=UPI0026DC7EE7|nr:hypothetical protein [Fusobacterium sp.]MDO4690196.1 hypothetical protein [Fusobacterium sp.]